MAYSGEVSSFVGARSVNASVIQADAPGRKSSTRSALEQFTKEVPVSNMKLACYPLCHTNKRTKWNRRGETTRVMHFVQLLVHTVACRYEICSSRLNKRACEALAKHFDGWYLVADPHSDVSPWVEIQESMKQLGWPGSLRTKATSTPAFEDATSGPREGMEATHEEDLHLQVVQVQRRVEMSKEAALEMAESQRSSRERGTR